MTVRPVGGFEPGNGLRHLSKAGADHRPTSSSGGDVDQQLKQLMKELGEAINESLADSEQIVGVSKPGEKSDDKTSLVTTLTTNPEFKISDQDLKFLKSLRIKIENDAA